MLVASLLIGCDTTPDPEPGDGLPYVTVSSGGSIFGAQAMTIFANDTALYSGHDGTPDGVWSATETLPDGTYAETRRIALQQIARLDPGAKTQVCMDYGSDVITVWDGPDKVMEARMSCPNADMKAAQIEVQNHRDLVTGALEQ